MIPQSAIGQLNLHLSISPTLLIAAFALVLAWWLIFTLIIRYHWKNFSVGRLMTFSVSFLYMAGSLVLIGLMLISLALYAGSTI